MSTIKFHFEDPFKIERMAYQKEAITAVTDLFRGQEQCRSEFTVLKPQKMQTEFRLAYLNEENLSEEDIAMRMKDEEELSTLGIGNKLSLLPEHLLENLNAVQFKYGLTPSTSIGTRNFTVEMETGTGKTYVYLRTIYELHQEYGFTKFVIVVPSVAIKEGVAQTIKQTKEHFLSLYPSSAGVNAFVYDSSKMSDIRDFATNDSIQIMVMTIGAMNKLESNRFYENMEDLGGEKPVDLVRATKPILIIDEPQSVDGGANGKGKEALKKLDALATFRYSATHIDTYNQIYSLDAFKAYQLQLVKQIEVAAMEKRGDNNRAYVQVLKIRTSKGTVIADLELDVEKNGKITRKEVKGISSDTLLKDITGRSLYEGLRIGEIKSGANGYVTLLADGREEIQLSVGNGINGLDADSIARAMIAETIRHHLDKELVLTNKGIKVLSLFFIDSVNKYRVYGEEGSVSNGVYADIFEDEYNKAIALPKYATLFKDVDTETLAQDVHNGYFARDKKKISSKGNESTVQQIHTPFDDFEFGASKAGAVDDSYSLIMKEKERLLNFDTKLKFIFSHSALQEGWDNPNVFQICNLRDMNSERQRRQTLGRGLRLCVNQNGERLHGFDINTLTVIANESYESFAEALQKEIESETGIRFGIVSEDQFAAIPVKNIQEDGTVKYEALGVEESKAIYNYLKAEEYIEKSGTKPVEGKKIEFSKVTDKLKTAIEAGALKLPNNLDDAIVENISSILEHLTSKLKIKDARNRKTVALNKERYLDPSFKELWDRIKHQTVYQVDFNEEKLIEKCIDTLNRAESIKRTQVRFINVNLDIDEAGVAARDIKKGQYKDVKMASVPLPDIITEVEAKTNLTRKAIVEILLGCSRLDDFKENPQEFIEIVVSTIISVKKEFLVDGVSYKKIGEKAVYAQELLESEELTGYLENLQPVTKSVYSDVVYDSQIEKEFAQELENHDEVKVFVKLPGWFTIPTPLGSYNPDWAVVIEKDGIDKLYFVVETKGTRNKWKLRPSEKAKIECAEIHFKALGDGNNPADYKMAVELDDIL